MSIGIGTINITILTIILVFSFLMLSISSILLRISIVTGRGFIASVVLIGIILVIQTMTNISLDFWTVVGIIVLSYVLYAISQFFEEQAVNSFVYARNSLFIECLLSMFPIAYQTVVTIPTNFEFQQPSFEELFSGFQSSGVDICPSTTEALLSTVDGQNGVRARMCPDTGCTTVEFLQPGDPVVVIDTDVAGELIGNSSTWYQVCVSSKSLYVYGDLLSEPISRGGGNQALATPSVSNQATAVPTLSPVVLTLPDSTVDTEGVWNETLIDGTNFLVNEISDTTQSLSLAASIGHTLSIHLRAGNPTATSMST